MIATTKERVSNYVPKTNGAPSKKVIDLKTMNPNVGIEATPYVVMRTLNYDMFTDIDGNRIKKSPHIKNLIESMTEEYLLSPILVNEHYNTIDGQHRLEAVKELNYPVYFIMVPGYGKPQVKRLNVNSSNWTRIDFLNSYCSDKVQPYLTVRNFMRQFPDLGIQSILFLLTGDKSGSKVKKTKGASVRTRDFEEGRLKINDEAWAEATAKKLMDIKPFYKDFTRLTFVHAMVGIMKHPKYKHKEFLAKLEKRPGALYNCVNVEEYKILIEDIYNYRRSDKVGLRY